MKKIKIDIAIYIAYTFLLYSIIIFPFHNRHAINFSIIFYGLFSFLFWLFYLFVIKTNIGRVYLLSLPCLVISCFYFNIFDFSRYEYLGLFGIFEQAVFYYFILGYFILDLMLYLSCKKNKMQIQLASVGRLSEPTFTGFQHIDIINLNSNIPIFQAT